MSTNNFTFPPPPPPPPQRHYDPSTQYSRGRANGAGAFRGRGGLRGAFNQRGTSYGGRGRGNSNYNSSSLSQVQTPLPTFAPSSLSTSSKRSHAAAFSSNPRSRPVAPPAVPSFNDSLASLLPPKPVSTNIAAKPTAAKKTNMLGLTPARVDESESEDDLDEESRMANAPVAGGLQFEYLGQVATLRTAAEIAAWIADRRKRWPTAAKREAAKKVAEERKLKWEEEKRKKAQASQAAKQKRLENYARPAAFKSKQSTAAESSLSERKTAGHLLLVQGRAERLRRKAAKAQKQLEDAERDLLNVQYSSDRVEVPDAKAGSDDSLSTTSDSSELTESDSSSSSGSSSDNDSAPEVLSSKIEVQELQTHPQQTVRKKTCLYYAKHGSCKFGAKCKYVHDQARVSSRSTNAKPARSLVERKGIWQVMVEKEQEEERKRVLQAIISLGKQGALNDAP